MLFSDHGIIIICVFVRARARVCIYEREWERDRQSACSDEINCNYGLWELSSVRQYLQTFSISAPVSLWLKPLWCPQGDELFKLPQFWPQVSLWLRLNCATYFSLPDKTLATCRAFVLSGRPPFMRAFSLFEIKFWKWIVRINYWPRKMWNIE